MLSFLLVTVDKFEYSSSHIFQCVPLP